MSDAPWTCPRCEREWHPPLTACWKCGNCLECHEPLHAELRLKCPPEQNIVHIVRGNVAGSTLCTDEEGVPYDAVHLSSSQMIHIDHLVHPSVVERVNCPRCLEKIAQ